MYNNKKALTQFILAVFCLLVGVYNQCGFAGPEIVPSTSPAFQVRVSHESGIAIIDQNIAQDINRCLLEQNVGVLEINSIPFASGAFELMAEILSSRERGENLTMIGFVQNNLGPASVTMLVRIIEANPQLVHIDLSNNNFGPEGSQIVNALRNHRNLQSLNLSGNNLDLNSMFLVTEVLRHNPRLFNANLGGNNFSSDDFLVAASSWGNRNLDDVGGGEEIAYRQLGEAFSELNMSIDDESETVGDQQLESPSLRSDMSFFTNTLSSEK